MPHLENLHQRFGDWDVEVVVIDIRNMRDETREVAEQASLTIPVLLDDKDISKQKFSVFATPTTLLVDSSGRAVFRHVGFAEGQEQMLEKEIYLLLEPPTS